MKDMAAALTAMTALALGTVGCTAAAPAGGHRGPSPHGSATAAAVAGCTAGQLGATFKGSSEPGTAGNALAIVYIWNRSATACTLPGPVTVAGLDQADRQVTMPVRFTIEPRSPRLSPDGTGPGKRGRMPGGEVSASLLLIAAGTHPNDPSLACPGQQIDPAAFRIVLASGASITTPNASASHGPALTRDGGLMICRGSLGGQSPILIARN
jgi:hypothetical protein